MSNEMIMVGEDCPSFEVPAEIRGQFEKAALENIEAFRRMEMMCSLVSAGGDEIGAGLT